MVAVVVVALVGALLVGPLLSYAILHWMAWRVTLPLLFGFVPPRRSVGRAQPRCRNCGSALAPGGLPASPWLLSAGRCRSCREPLARWPLGVELTTGGLFALASSQYDRWALLVPILVFFAGLVATSTVDLLCSRIPTRFVYLTGLGVAVAAVPHVVDVPETLTAAAVGGAVGLGSLGAMHLVAPHMLGFGDVRLGTLIGLVVGWVGWTAADPVLDPLSRVVQALFLAGVVGSLLGFALLAVRRRNQTYPFGPCLALGGVLAIVLA